MVFNKGQKAWNSKDIDEDLMISLYFDMKWDYLKIANYFGFKSKSAIYDRFKRLGLKARTNTDLKIGFKHSEETKKRIKKSLIKFPEGTINPEGYLRKSGLDKYQLEHRSVWIKYNGNIPKGQVIHHTNGNKLDNRIENLQMMSLSNHIKLHLSE